MGYKTTTVDYNGKVHAAGKPIVFAAGDEGHRDALLTCDPPAIVGSDKPLERMTKAELAQTAADEGVEVAADATNQQIAEAIAAARAVAQG